MFALCVYNLEQIPKQYSKYQIIQKILSLLCQQELYYNSEACQAFKNGIKKKNYEHHYNKRKNSINNKKSDNSKKETYDNTNPE